MGKINIGFFYGKLFNSRNRTFSLENGENFIEGTGQQSTTRIAISVNSWKLSTYVINFELHFWVIFQDHCVVLASSQSTCHHVGAFGFHFLWQRSGTVPMASMARISAFTRLNFYIRGSPSGHWMETMVPYALNNSLWYISSSSTS